MASNRSRHTVKENGRKEGTARPQPNEGEGNRTAARRYDREATDFAHSGRVKDQAEAAKAARDGAERPELDRAEEAGRAHAKGEDPDVKR